MRGRTTAAADLARNAVCVLAATILSLPERSWAAQPGSAQAQSETQSYTPTQGSFLVQVELFNLNGKTNKTGSFVMECHPSWAPFAVARY